MVMTYCIQNIQIIVWWCLIVPLLSRHHTRPWTYKRYNFNQSTIFNCIGKQHWIIFSWTKSFSHLHSLSSNNFPNFSYYKFFLGDVWRTQSVKNWISNANSWIVSLFEFIQQITFHYASISIVFLSMRTRQTNQEVIAYCSTETTNTCLPTYLDYPQQFKARFWVCFAYFGTSELMKVPLQKSFSLLPVRSCIYIPHRVFGAYFPCILCISEKEWRLLIEHSVLIL